MRALIRAFSFSVALLFVPASIFALNLKRLEPAEEALRSSIIQTLDPVIAPKKTDGTAVLLKWEELYAPLNKEQQAFLDAFRALRAKDFGSKSHYYGDSLPDNLTSVGPQTMIKDGTPTPVDPQYLPKPALESYRRMMAAMKADIGKELLVESGYRSPAYQLYLFIFYMSNHEMSVVETKKHVALPGYSEHGAAQNQAIDFINEAAVNGEYNPPEFEALPEYAWLNAHANAYGFFLSYPRGNAKNTAFEPWHWHYEAARDTMKPKPGA